MDKIAAFTLIELLVTLTVLGIVLALGLGNFRGAQGAQREVAAMRGLSVMLSATSRYARNHRQVVAVREADRVVEAREGDEALEDLRVSLPDTLSGPSGTLLSFDRSGTTTPTVLVWVGRYDRYALRISAIGEVTREN